MPRRPVVLVVEDDAGIRRMLDVALSSLGFEPRLADGQGALDEADVDVLIMDVRLGSRSAADVLREHRLFESIPLVVATAGDPASAQRIRPDALLLRKPFDLEALQNVLSEALARARVPRP